MNNILTADELKALKDIDKKLDESKINPIIEMAQITELKDVLGSDFLFDVINNINNPIYQDLLSGSTFTCGNNTYYQDGIKALLADYFMSKYALTINTNFTPFGATVKQSNDSTPVERNTLKDISMQQMQLAGSRWEVIKMYLDENTTLFPKWSCMTICGGKTHNERTFRIRKI